MAFYQIWKYSFFFQTESKHVIIRKKQYSVTEFLKRDQKKIPGIFPEHSNTKEIKLYIFKNKVESQRKRGKTRGYSDINEVDKKGRICNKIEKLRAKYESNFWHRSHVDDIAEVLPIIRQKCTEKYIELYFSEHQALKHKFEV